MLKDVLFFLSILFVSAFLGWMALNKFYEWDSPLGWARSLYPLNGQAEYILKKKPQENLTDNTQLSEGSFYFIAKEDNDESQYSTSGRQVGRTEVDLEPFVGKKVHIWGTHYIGAILLLKDTELPDVLKGSQKVVIHVKKVEIVK